MQSRRIPSIVPALTLILSFTAASAAEPWRPEPLPRDEEFREALAAGPEAIRDTAGVYVLTEGGYELARESADGFHCLIERSQPGTFEPQCLDAEGSATLLPAILLEASLRMSGASEAEIERAVGVAWAEGKLSAPRRPGINYMLSERNMVPVGPEQVIPYGPHVMFYAPHLTSEDLGAAPMGASPVFVVNEGQPSAYVIVPVADTEGGH